MYLKENLQRLKKIYSAYPINFVEEKDYIKVEEETKYFFSSNEELKTYLQEKYKMKFTKKILWHIGAEGIKLLSKKPIKEKPTKSIEDLKKELSIFINKIEEESLKKTIQELFDAYPYFYECPASMYYHHDYIGGLLEHSVQTARLAFLTLMNLSQITDISVISKDLIVAGALLHDIGKIQCYKMGDGFILSTNILYEQGHIISGVALISKYIKSEQLDELIHIIASHHATMEWGSPIEPKSFEAWVIHTQEYLSSKIAG